MVGVHDMLSVQKHDVLTVNCEQRMNHEHDFQEIFSVPRIAPVATQKGLKCGDSLDLRNGWNFLDSDHRKQCRDLIMKHKPRVLAVTPPCGPFSSLQRISQNKGDPLLKRKKHYEGCVLLQFAMELCELQASLGGIFIFEHPLYADSWKHECVQKVHDLPNVHAVVLDQCCFGLQDPWSQKPFKKPTKLLTNSQKAGFLGQRCKGQHQHQHIEGQTWLGGKWINRSLCAQVYPKKLVEGLVKLISMEVKQTQQEVFAAETLKFEQPNIDLQAAVMRCHVNLGHPSRERFLHMLRSANASEKTIECAKQLKCSTCSAKRLQESHAVSKHKRAEHFNQQLNIDVFDLPIYQNKVLKMLNILDEGTSMQLCLPLWKGARASEIRKQYRRYWKRWAGVPQKVLTDGGTEFDNEVQEGFDLDGTYVEKTAAFAPWQNGACERYGGIWKEAFSKAFDESQPRNKNEVNELIDQVNVARNTLARRHGFTPYQHIFGNDLRLPGLITENEGMQHMLEGRGAVHQGDEFHERHRMRMAARKAMVQLDEDDKVRRALDHRMRPKKNQFEIGQLVYFWRRDNQKRGVWKGPARVIGFYDSSKIWVCHGNKVLRCAPEQLRALTEDQEAAIKFVPIQLLSKSGRFAKCGAQTFLDLTKQEPPDSSESVEPLPKRARHDHISDGDVAVEQQPEEPEINEHEGPQSIESSIDEESTHVATSNNDDDLGNVNPGTTAEESSSFGPIREGRLRYDDNVTLAEHENSALTRALRISCDMLDMGDVRMRRTPYSANREGNGDDEMTPDTLEVVILPDDPEDQYIHHFEAFLINVNRNSELKDKELDKSDWEQVNVGKKKELEKLLKSRAIKIFSTAEADRIRSTVPRQRILESRFVKTRRTNPDDPNTSEIKCRWVVRGFQDPDVEILERQSPTLTADGLACVLQLLASMRWSMNVADIEGAFLQGDEYNRETGPIYVALPHDTFPGLPENTIFQLTKCVYGLMDAPLRWWKSLERTLKDLTMKQSELDPCIFYWYKNDVLHGALAVHVDDLLIGGSKDFMDEVIAPLKAKYPFKHWKTGKSDFLGRNLVQNDDFSICIDQKEYANNVKPAIISKERRKFKEDKLTAKELHQYHAILGAANWLVGSSRPDIAALTALLQQRVSSATIDDLISANKLIAKIRDFAHTKITVQSIPLDQAVLVVASDSSWGNSDDLGNQARYFTMLAHSDIDLKQWATISPMRWKSYKVDRKTPSTLGAELIAVSRAISEGNWMRSLLAEALHVKYYLDCDKMFRERIKLMVLVDCKPIYDHVQGEQTVIKDKRLAIEMLIVRRDLRNQNSELRWIDTRQMISDPLTKIFADCDFLRYVIRKGKMIVVEENDQLKWRQGEKRASA